MTLANSFLLIIIFMGVLAIGISSYMDGVEKQPEVHSFNKVLISVMINWLLIFGAIAWAINH